MGRQTLVNILSLSQYVGVPVRTLRTFMAARKIPYLKIGHRTVLFDPEKVGEALRRFGIRAVGDNEPRGINKTKSAF